MERDNASATGHVVRAGWAQLLLRDNILTDWNRYVRAPAFILSVALVVAILCGLFLHPRGLVLASALGVIVVAGLLWPWLSIRGVVAHVDFDKIRTRENESVKLQATITNRWLWPAWGVAIRGRDVGEPDFAVSAVGPWRRLSVARPWQPSCRGVVPKSDVVLATAFPFGLVEATRPVAVARQLTVWPRSFSLNAPPDAAAGHGREGRLFRNVAGTAGDVLGVRPYRRGDSLRRIHWPQTARHDRLVVCEQQSPAAPWVQLVLDTEPAVHGGVGSDGSREWAIRAAASLLEAWLAWGAPVEAIIASSYLAADLGDRHRQRLLDALARIPADEQSSLADLLTLPECRRFAGGLQVVLTTDVALSRLTCGPGNERRRRWVVFHAAGFGAAPSVGDLGVRPWAWIDHPNNVARHLRAAWREVRGDG